MYGREKYEKYALYWKFIYAFFLSYYYPKLPFMICFLTTLLVCPVDYSPNYYLAKSQLHKSTKFARLRVVSMTECQTETAGI